MGSPKALLQYQGETFLGRMQRLLASACDAVVVVLAPGTEAWVEETKAMIAVNPDPDRGMLSSLQCGFARQQSDRYLFTPMDYPSVTLATVQAVAAAEGEIVIPRCEDKRGHPVCVSHAVAQELLAIPVETGTPADVIRRDATRIHYVEVNDPGIHRDIDLPSEYQELILQC
jgi:molybdenum cofactor cytidylyltransferase